MINKIKETSLVHLKHWADRLVAMFCHLMAGVIIQKSWNNITDYIDWLPQIGLFESTILWVCLYYV